MPSFIIVGYVWRILGRRGQKAPPHPWAAPKKPILNRVRISLFHCFWISINYLLLTYIYCCNITIFFRTTILPFGNLQMVKQKSYLLLENLNQLRNINIDSLFMSFFIFIPVNCSFKTSILLFKQFCIIHSWDIKCCISYWKFCGMSCISGHYNGVFRQV